MRTLLLIEGIQIGNMLEIVGVEFTALHNLIRLYIIVEHGHFQSPALCCQKGRCLFQDLSVRCSGCCDGDRAFGLCRLACFFRVCSLIFCCRPVFCGCRLFFHRSCRFRVLRLALCRLTLSGRCTVSGTAARCQGTKRHNGCQNSCDKFFLHKYSSISAQPAAAGSSTSFYLKANARYRVSFTAHNFEIRILHGCPDIL